MSVVRPEQLMTSYANFLASQQTEDHFSKKLRELYDKKGSAVSNMTKEQLKKIELFLNIIKQDNENNKKYIDAFLDKFKEKKEFQNLLPYFEYFLLIDYDFFEFFKISDIEKSYSQFEKLAKKLFPNVFTSDKKLKAFFISLFSFNLINPESIGLYNIDVLEKIFIDNLLNYSSRINFTNFLTDYFNEDAFGLQYQNMIEQAKKPNESLFSESTFLNFNCKLWFDEFDKVKSYDLSAFLNFVGSDSFGSFAIFPDRKHGTYSSIGITTSTENIVNKNTLRCFVFPKVKMTNGASVNIFSDRDPRFSNITFDQLSRTSSSLQNLIAKNPGFKIFYNVTPTSPSSNISILKKGTEYELHNTKQLYINPPDINVVIAGGSSKKNKMKGGSEQNLFDPAQSPSVIFDRPLKNYDKDSFFECVKKLRGLATLKQITNYLNRLLTNFIESTSIVYPVVYTEGHRDSEGKPQKLGVIQIVNQSDNMSINYEEIRLLFLFSSIFTTFIQLFNRFFTFLSKTYTLIIEYYEKSQKQSSAKNRNQNTAYWFNQISKFENLSEIINKIAQILQLSISTKDKKDKFFGFNLKFYELFLVTDINSNNYEEALKIQLKLYETVIDLVCNGLIEIETSGIKKLSLKPNIFFKSLQQFGKLFQINFGGIPLISDKEQIQQSVIESYKYFAKYLFACQKSFIDYAKYHNSEKNEKAKKNVIEDIEANVTREIQELKPKTNIIDTCKIILKKVLEKFILKLHEIHNIYSRYKNNSSPESRGINNSNSKNKELKKKLGEFKIYIAIMERSLQQLLNPLSNTSDKQNLKLFSPLKDKLDSQTLKLFMMRRFNNFSSLLEYVILNIRNKSIKDLLYPMGIQIDFDKSNHREDVNKLFALLENRFFKFKPDLSKSFKILLQNTGFYYRSPSFENIEWWVQIMDNFRDRDSGKRLFILGTLRRFGITNKIGVDDPVLIDVESCALVPVGEEIPTKKFLDIDYTVDKSGKITEMRYQPAKNTIINLTPFLRYIREGYAKFKKQTSSREDRGRIMKALIKTFEFRNTNGNNKTPLSTIGNIIRLLKGKLKNNAGVEIKPVILQAANPKQLAEIIRSRILDKRTSNITYSSNQSRMDYQLIRLDKNDLKDSSLFRKFLSRVLFSSPESYYSPEVALEFNLFNLFQVGLSSKYFTTSFGKGSLVIDFFSALQPDDLESIIGKFKTGMNSSRNQNSKIATLKEYALEIAEKMKLINQQELQKLLIEREVNYVNVNNIRKKKLMNNQENENLFSSRSEYFAREMEYPVERDILRESSDYIINLGQRRSNFRFEQPTATRSGAHVAPGFGKSGSFFESSSPASSLSGSFRGPMFRTPGLSTTSSESNPISLFASLPAKSGLSPRASAANLSASINSRTLNNKKNLDNIQPRGFYEWINFIKSLTGNNFLNINKYNPHGTQWTIVLEFLKGSKRYISISYVNNSKKFYINDFSAPEGNQDSEIKSQQQFDKSQVDYYADCKSRGQIGKTFFIFNFYSDAPIIIQSDRGQQLYSLTYNPSNGYSFEPIGSDV